MARGKIISLCEYKEKARGGVLSGQRALSDRELPKEDRLWELLEKNINLSVWKSAR